MTVLPDKLENLMVEKNVELINGAVLENSCLREVNNCLIAKHLFTALLSPRLKQLQKQDTPEIYWRQLVQPVFGNVTKFV